MPEELGQNRIGQKRFEALVHESVSKMCRYAYWLCGDWTTAELLIDATLSGEQRLLEGAGENEVKALRRMIAALHKEHGSHRDKQGVSNQRKPVDRGGEKVVDAELRNLRVGIASLPTTIREPLMLQSIGYSIDDIAELLELNVVIVAARLVHAWNQLQVLSNSD